MAIAQTKPQEAPLPGPFPLIEGEHTNAGISNRFAGFVLHRRVSLGYAAGALLCFGLVNLMFLAIAWLLFRGVGVWGINVPVAWGFAITNFVWWIGIGHAGTLISAVLWLMHQKWRTSINRFAEAMTLFAVACAGLFPLLHLGRPEYFYFLLPYPNTFGLWPQWRSPLVWDFAAVLTYLTVSLIFWYVGLIPDLATMRDSSRKGWAGYIFALLSLGWRGEASHWRNHQAAYTILAGLATPLVVSVHSIVSFDFSVSIVPGWHSTNFPPYFVAGAIFSGFAMVLTLTIPLRACYGLQDVITMRHLENCAKLMLATGLFVAFSYAMEWFFAYYSGQLYERYINLNRVIGHYGPAYWVTIVCNIVLPQLLWFRRVRTSVPMLFLMSLIVQAGMWTERFVIVVTSLHRDYMPSAWRMFYPTFWDIALLLGTIGFFFLCFLIFIRLLPMSSMSELRKLAHEEQTPGPHRLPIGA